MKRLALACAIVCVISAAFAADQHFAYPKPQKSNQTDAYFGTKVADPYRGLEMRIPRDEEVDRGGKQSHI